MEVPDSADSPINPYESSPVLDADRRFADRVQPLRLTMATIAAVTFFTIGLAAPLLPNFVVCFRMGWVLGFFLLSTAAFSMAVQSTFLRLILAAVSASFVGQMNAFLISYDFRRDNMLYRADAWQDVPLVFVIVGVMFSFIPAFHCLRIEGKLAAHDKTGRDWRPSLGARTGARQAAFILAITTPLLFLLSGTSSGGRSVPLEIRHGPTGDGKLSYLLIIIVSVLLAGAISGFLAGLLPSKRPELQTNSSIDNE